MENRISFKTPSGTFTKKVDANVMESTFDGKSSLPTVSVPLATVYVAAYSVQTRPNGEEKANRAGCLRAARALFRRLLRTGLLYEALSTSDLSSRSISKIQ